MSVADGDRHSWLARLSTDGDYQGKRAAGHTGWDLDVQLHHSGDYSRGASRVLNGGGLASDGHGDLLLRRGRRRTGEFAIDAAGRCLAFTG